MDLLIVLVEQANKVVGRRTLIERVWPKRGAESTSQRYGKLSIIRKALGERQFGSRYISNIEGGAYSFIGSVVCIE
jgi:DNA-binding winged helix-turn-helix (wHTH) protein